MLKNKIKLFSVFAVIAGISVAVFLVGFKGEAQTQSNNKLEAKVLRKDNSANVQLNKKELDDAATPIVDYDSPNAESVSSDRIAKNARYDGRRISAIPDSFRSAESVWFSHSLSSLDLPADESELIVEGKVTDSAAYLSNDKGVVYSEFTVRVKDVIKTTAGINVNKNDSIVTERIGGRVRYSDGRITRYTTLGQGSPMKGKKYLLFLTKEESGNYKILTGYELQGNKVFALDGPQLTRRPQTIWASDKHNGQDYQKFKEEVEKAKNNPQDLNQNRRFVTPQKNVFFKKIILFCISLGLFFSFAPNFNVNAQCTTRNSPGVVQKGFPRGANVQVYIDSNTFNAGQMNAIRTAFGNWQNASTANNSNVTFTFVNTIPPAGTYQYLVGHEQPVVNQGVRAESGTPISDSAGNTQQAVTVIDPRVTEPAAILELISHEIGHPMGLDDCLTCSSSDSVMAPGPNPNNPNFWNTVVGRPTSPTPCDNQILQQSNYPAPCSNPEMEFACPQNGGLWNSETCICEPHNHTGGGYVGGGGSTYPEPGYYCTPYYWVYYESWDNGETWYMVDMSYAGCW